MGDTALSNAELELTQKIQMHFPRGAISGEILRKWNGCPIEVLSARLTETFGQFPEAKKVEEPFFTISAVTSLAAVPAKPQSECFVGDRWSYRDGDFGNWFKKDQLEAAACTVTTISFKRQWRFMEFAIAILGNEWKGKSVKEIGNEIIRRGLTLTNAQAEVMVEKTEAGEKTDMRTDGYGNLYFTQTGDAENPVAVAFVDRGVRLWNARVGRLGYGFDWRADFRFLLRNLEVPSTL